MWLGDATRCHGYFVRAGNVAVATISRLLDIWAVGLLTGYCSVLVSKTIPECQWRIRLPRYHLTAVSLFSTYKRQVWALQATFWLVLTIAQPLRLPTLTLGQQLGAITTWRLLDKFSIRSIWIRFIAMVELERWYFILGWWMIKLQVFHHHDTTTCNIQKLEKEEEKIKTISMPPSGLSDCILSHLITSFVQFLL